ncbi:hypothetical protein R3W88_007729 [Solanum pinnatisectum]|uniref:Glycine-rich protein n=1 Tax=Solanum pinnatisectum TaxID=50273 RepID=A0AAV9M6P0_9SOLN|nr:hypothetical protein R3W88_007729 [Solanum pinnatisectum]
MMGSKAFLFLGIFLVIFAIISFEVVARELMNAYNNGYKYFGGGYYPPRGGYNFPGSGYKPSHEDYNNRYKSLGRAYNNGYNPPSGEYTPPT